MPLVQLASIIRGLREFREQVIGTLTLLTLLVLVFQVELIVSEIAGAESVQNLLNSPSADSKFLIPLLAGPLIHQSADLLIGNLGVLLISGSYVEYALDRKRMYQIFFGCGYLSAWVPLLNGSVGAVGASGGTFALTAAMIVVGFGVCFLRIVQGESLVGVPHLLAGMVAFIHVIPLVQGIINGSLSGAGDAAHAFGALFGFSFALVLVIDQRTGVYSGVYLRVRNQFLRIRG